MDDQSDPKCGHSRDLPVTPADAQGYGHLAGDNPAPHDELQRRAYGKHWPAVKAGIDGVNDTTAALRVALDWLYAPRFAYQFRCARCDSPIAVVRQRGSFYSLAPCPRCDANKPAEPTPGG